MASPHQAHYMSWAFNGANPWVNTGEKHQTTLIDIISMKLGQYKRHPVIPNPPFFLHFTILMKDMCIGFTRKKIIPRSPWWPPTPRFKAPWLATSKRCVGTQGMEGVPRYQKTTGIFFWRILSIKNYISHQPVCDTPKKNIYICSTYSINLCDFFLVIFFWGGEYRLPKTNIAPFFVWVFGFGGTWTACIWLFTTSKGHATSQPGRLEGVVSTSSQGMTNMSHLGISLWKPKL